MKIIITDTNVFIDLIRSNALVHFFQLDYEICTTDLVVEEIKLPDQQQQLEAFRASGRLKVIELNAAEIQEAVELPTKCNLKRITDKSVLLKAIHLQCLVLSGDGDLRKECTRNGLEVHGSVWVVRELWIANLTNVQTLQTVLDEMLKNTRLPQHEIEKLKLEISETK
jgi:rRNA-processing protein FCF1